MLNIKDLEARHTKYKIRSYIPYVITVIILITILIVASNLYDSNNIKKEKTLVQKPIEKQIKKIILKEHIEINTTSVSESNKTKEVKINTTEKEKITKPKKVILTPSLDFMRRVNTPVEVYSNKKDKVKAPKNKKRVIKEEVIVEEVVTTPIVQDEVIKPKPLKIEKKRSIKIKITKDQEDIQDVIKRFKVNNNPALSLFVAKKYYQLGDYHKSYNYALITNQLNNNIEASWIIFAKSQMKLNKKDMAIDTLKKYIDSSHSPRAKILLDEIQSGKFK